MSNCGVLYKLNDFLLESLALERGITVMDLEAVVGKENLDLALSVLASSRNNYRLSKDLLNRVEALNGENPENEIELLQGGDY